MTRMNLSMLGDSAVHDILPFEGPWADEPDFASWDYLDGMKGIASRHPYMGHWCGYVTLPKDHPWTSEKADPFSEVHGGITFHGVMDHILPGTDLVAVGFDCGHAGDLSPAQPLAPRGKYRTLQYVMKEVDRLHEDVVKAAELST